MQTPFLNWFINKFSVVLDKLKAMGIDPLVLYRIIRDEDGDVARIELILVQEEHKSGVLGDSREHRGFYYEPYREKDT